ncbi:hypothetical protein PFICI_09123 [Pestalotiopsis fici W106-1]|uniref:F-box domain-containing protein n=1 Tax=Pestalotiopsis fici (strain W106-1 / CGMCC3.15140) TaxID=1229662 RepID=W3WZK6_PESFW|nr:uncharacterized protein PFICI_09123 [Pestalotiopsis fici W106-1]ETS79270.1 hypothetical protein PFICI_09123 [Pestalotiopsis fici W106-1]
MLSAFSEQPGLGPATRESTDASIHQRLTIELHLLIIEHLERDDFAAYLRVCRAWRHAGLSDDVWPRFADACLPGLKERIRLESENDQSIIQSDLFRRSLMLICRRSHGKFTTVFENNLRLDTEDYFQLDTSLSVLEGGVHSYDDYLDADFTKKLARHIEVNELMGEETDLESTKRLLWYSHGRIAWTSTVPRRPLLIVIDELRTRIRKAYSFPGHTTSDVVYETALGDQLFVMTSGHKMCIWHMERDTCTSVTLPLPLTRCSTEGERVLAVTTNAEVYMWMAESGMQKIDMSSVTGYKHGYLEKCYFGYFGPGDLGPPLQASLCLSPLGHFAEFGARPRLSYIDSFDFIMHPYKANTIFMAAFHDKALVVYEFNDGSWKAHHAPKTIKVSHAYLRHILLRKTSSHGDYVLCEISLRASWSNEQKARQLGICCPKSGGDVEISISFNIYTKAFSIARHHFRGHYLPTSSKMLNKAYSIWNQQLVHISSFPHSFDILAIGECQQDSDFQHNRRQVKVRNDLSLSSSVSKSLIVLHDFKESGQDSHQQDIEFYLDRSGVSSAKHFWQGEKLPKDKSGVMKSACQKTYVLGDDEYLILTRGDGVYTVHGFDKGF